MLWSSPGHGHIWATGCGAPSVVLWLSFFVINRGQCGCTGAVLLSVPSAQKALWSTKRGKYYIIKSLWKQSSSRLGISENSISFSVGAGVSLILVSPFTFHSHIKTTSIQKPFYLSVDIEFSLLAVSLLVYDSIIGV